MSAAQDGGETSTHSDTPELTAPDISPYRKGNSDIPYVTTWESGQPGPHVMVCALTHGNEISGAIALDHLFHNDIRPVQGRLSLVLANPTAFGLFDPKNPYRSRFVDEDMNRLWNAQTLSQDIRNVERLRVQALRPLVDSVDLLLDLHSMQSGNRPLFLCGPSEKGRRLARSLNMDATIVADMGHANGTRMRDYGRFNTPGDSRNSLLAECGPHWHPGTAKIAIQTTYRFLHAAGSIASETAAPHVGSGKVSDRWVEVTDRFIPKTETAAFDEPFIGLETIPTAGTTFAREGGQDFTTPYDDCVLIMPTRHLAKGQTAVRLGRWRAFPGPHDA